MGEGQNTWSLAIKWGRIPAKHILPHFIASGGLGLGVPPAAVTRQPTVSSGRAVRCVPARPRPRRFGTQLDELDVLSDSLDELLAVADTHAELGQYDAQVGRAWL
jgi:hypothetical protein